VTEMFPEFGDDFASEVDTKVCVFIVNSIIVFTCAFTFFLQSVSFLFPSWQCLAHFGYDVERTLNGVFEGTLPKHLASIPPKDRKKWKRPSSSSSSSSAAATAESKPVSSFDAYLARTGRVSKNDAESKKTEDDLQLNSFQDAEELHRLQVFVCV
jgi:hypothetical protein